MGLATIGRLSLLGNFPEGRLWRVSAKRCAFSAQRLSDDECGFVSSVSFAHALSRGLDGQEGKTFTSVEEMLEDVEAAAAAAAASSPQLKPARVEAEYGRNWFQRRHFAAQPRLTVMKDPEHSDQTTHRVVPPLLGSLVCTPSTAVVGDSIYVEVRAPDGTAYDNTGDASIAINGILGSSQFLVWSTPGTHRVVVTARPHGGPVEQMVATVQIAPAAAGPSPPFLRIRWLPHQPNCVQLSVVRLQVPAKASPGQRPGRAVAVSAIARPMTSARPAPFPAIAGEQIAHATTEARHGDAGGPNASKSRVTVTRISTAMAKAKNAVAALAGPSQPLYTWECSDGTSMGSIHSTYTHDFGPSLDPNRSHSVFHVTVTVQDPGSVPITIRRSISVANSYYMMKRRGVCQPPIVDSDLSAQFEKGTWHATFTVRNPESLPITLTSRTVEHLFDTEAGLADERDAAEAISIVLRAKSDTQIEVALPNRRVPKEGVALIVHFRGLTAGRQPVRVTATFDLPQRVKPTQVLSPAQVAQLKTLVAKGLLPNPKAFRTADVRSLVHTGAIAVGDVTALIGHGDLVPHVTRSHEMPPNASSGTVCDPWNMPEVIPDGMFCMPTAETKYVRMPARFMNARKGDIIVSPGDGSLIAATLAAVSPPQDYSHSGMMTRNRDEITHSTASMERMTDETYVDSGGFRPDILKYLWPGVITQTVQHATAQNVSDAETFVDPETGTPYAVGGFASLQAEQNDPDGAGAAVAVAMVIKPDPLTETSAVRAALHGIADFAAAQVGKSHYRFFCYTNPTIALNTSAPNEAKWAAGTYPSVCSALVWKSVRQSGAQIEQALEPADMAGGAQIAVGTPDGLYVYQSDERLAAGEVLYDRVRNLALQAAGQFWAGVTDIQTDLGNQVLNTFATDWSDSDATESDKWRQTSDANAVSPQNLFFYDAPLYGYSEPVIFRDERIEEVTVYRWRLVAQTGTLIGIVRYQGQALPGADVMVSETQATHSDASGSFALTQVPIGDLIVQAQKVIGGIRMSATMKVTITGAVTTNVTVDLTPPPISYRRILIDGSLMTMDYEFGAAVYPSHAADFNGIVDLDPSTATHVVRTYDCVADDDTLGRLILSFDLRPDGSVLVKQTIRCYDSNQADTDDYDEATGDPFVLAKDGHSHWYISIDGENYAWAYFHVQNVTDPS